MEIEMRVNPFLVEKSAIGNAHVCLHPPVGEGNVLKIHEPYACLRNGACVSAPHHVAAGQRIIEQCRPPGLHPHAQQKASPFRLGIQLLQAHRRRTPGYVAVSFSIIVPHLVVNRRRRASYGLDAPGQVETLPKRQGIACPETDQKSFRLRNSVSLQGRHIIWRKVIAPDIWFEITIHRERILGISGQRA